MSLTSAIPADDRSERQWAVIFWSVVAAIVVLSGLVITQWDFVGDEKWHQIQIEMFTAGDMRTHESLVTPPAYHLVVAGIAKPLGVSELNGYRLISLAISLPLLAVFRRMTRHLPPPQRAIRGLQVLCLPVLFPYWFLVYNDPFSLLLVLLATWATRSRIYWAAAILGAAATAVRQNNVIWVAFLQAFAFFQDGEGLTFKDKLKIHVRRGWPFLLVYAAVAVAVILHGSTTTGQQDTHPSFRLFSGNLFGAVFLAGLYFLPLHVANGSRIIAALASPKQIAAAAVVAVALFLLLHFTFDAGNPYHKAMTSCLVTQVAVSVGRTLHWELLFLVSVVATLLSLRHIAFEKRWHYLLYPASLLFLAPSWLIHARYYIIPFVLFQLFRRTSSIRLELACWGIMLILWVAFLAKQITS